MMKRYGDEKTYERTIKDEFIHGEFDLLIVVDKLLTGFDAPRATVLYVDKPLKEHNLLQAIARVNRLYKDKDRGFIIDFRGLLTELNNAMNVYSGSGLENFDPEDLADTLHDSMEIIAELRENYSHLLDLFKDVSQKDDREAYEEKLADQKLRETFYAALNKVEKSLKFAISSTSVYNAIEQEIQQIERDAKFYQELRKVVRIRYGDSVDMSELDPKMQKIIDRDISSEKVSRITKQINLTDENELLREIEYLEGDASRADAIRSRLSQRINSNYGKDPAYYKKFSEMIEETFNKYKEKRISEREYLEAMYQYADDYEKSDIINYPEDIKHKPDAQAFYGSLHDVLTEERAAYVTNKDMSMNEILGKMSVDIEQAIKDHTKVDWHENQDVKNNIEQAIEDVIFDYMETYNLDLDWDTIDKINRDMQEISRQRF